MTTEPCAPYADETIEHLLSIGALPMWDRWDDWSRQRGSPALGARAADVAAWITEETLLGDLEAPELDQLLDEIAARHRDAGHADPTQGERIGAGS